ncbi:amidophosphoribosyltransferase [Candidatus Parcubacteria bacterium]|nr:MAG: amidophosphoribosyltransferase [Candidatus Parcubacteria bacterium]
MDSLNEKCGIFGIYGKALDVSRLAFFGLFALQHRGQESSGISVGNGEEIRSYKNVGLVTHVYNEEIIQQLSGHVAIGHNRYSTSEGTGLLHAQPIIEGETFALAHNGNLPSITALVHFLERRDVPVKGHTDSELMAKAVYYYYSNGRSIENAVREAYPLFTGAFSLVMMTKDALLVLRDRCGVRPLAMGKLNGGYVFASENCAFHTIGAEFVREVHPGELIIVDNAGLRSYQLEEPTQKLDIFEFVYFARPDSTLLGKSVYTVRRNCGQRLAEETKIKADAVVPVPETAFPVAVGYSEATKIPIEMALVKNRYIHRTFIQPDQHSRDLGVKLKLTPLPEALKGKRIILIDDSIVRGTTSQQIVRALFEAGAKEVHFLVSSPPVKFPDFYGINTPRQKDLIASQKTPEEIREFLGATSLHYLSLEGLLRATGLPKSVFTTHFFTGEYPIPLHERERDFIQPSYDRPARPLGGVSR